MKKESKVFVKNASRRFKKLLKEGYNILSLIDNCCILEKGDWRIVYDLFLDTVYTQYLYPRKLEVSDEKLTSNKGGTESCRKTTRI